MNLFKRIIRKALRICGHVPGWEARQTRDLLLIDKFLTEGIKKDALCIDIGAHKGDFLVILKRNLPQAELIAVEPLPKFQQILRKEFPQVSLCPFALSDFKGESTFNYVVNDPGWSGFKKQTYEDLKFDVQEIKVQVDMFDNVFSGLERIDFVKIDVEGAEYLVLKGAKNLINKFKPNILFECAAIHMKNYTHTPKMLFDLVTQDLGLKIYSLQDLNSPLSEETFLKIVVESEASNYGTKAETNFVAK